MKISGCGTIRLCTTLFLLLLLACTTAPKSNEDLDGKFRSLEKSSKGRLGLSAINLANGKKIEYRANERFPLCSTFKAIVAAAILKKSMNESAVLEKHIAYSEDAIKDVGHAPVTKKNLAKGMTIGELCEAAITYSDNAAANLLMKEIGGPEGVTAFARQSGDKTFRLDRWEPELNTALPGDLRDTSTPSGIANLLKTLHLDDTLLGPPQRFQLWAWMKANTTGDKRIRAAVPKGWLVGDKTGTGEYGTTNDIGIIWPPGEAPIILAVYFTQDEKNAKPNDTIIAEATALVLSALGNEHTVE